MRILHVITSLRIGGAERLISEIAPIMKARGHQVDVFVFDGIDTFFKQSLQKAGIKVIAFKNNCSVYNPLFIFNLYQLRSKYDVIHTHLSSPQLIAAIACRSKVPLVTTEHNTENRRRLIKWLKNVDRWMYNQYKYVISISQKTEDNLKNYIGQSRCRFVTIHNGIDIDRFKDASPLDESTKGTSKTIITMVAAFREQKDQMTLVQSMKFLDTNRYEIWLVGDGEKRHQVESHVKELGLTNNVRFWGNRNDVPSILKSSDIVVMSSKWEGFGLSIVEGMAAKKPVIATDVDGLSQVVGNAGILFQVGDAKQLAGEIEQLSTDCSYYSTIAMKCELHAKEFDINIMVDKYLDVYNCCVSTPS